MGFFDFLKPKGNAQVGFPADHPPFVSAPSGELMKVLDVFYITGTGVIVTGMVSASIRVGQSVTVVSGSGEQLDSRIQAIQTGWKSTTDVAPGVMAGLVLAKIKKGQIAKGDTILAA